ncbi:hypothetical protein [Rubrivirga sp.]|uniref:hypothetical protein n=1 Tax=Rubrivirga sp. TaxID=1885344 RepID=UPI003C75932A
MTRPLLLLLVLAGCDASLDPILEADVYYSLSGYLDASADTHTVRVEPVGRVVETPPDGPLDVRVTLSGLGLEVELRQRVDRLVTGPAHRFWTTADLEAGRTYRLTVRDPNGAETATDVAIPALEDVDVEVVPGPNNCPVFVSVDGAPRLADVQAHYTVRSSSGAVERFEFSHLLAIDRGADDVYRTEVFSGDDTSRFQVEADAALEAEVVVAIGSEAWPEAAGLTLEAAIGYNGDVENGVGFVGGVVTQRYPFQPVISRGSSCMSGRR